MFVSLFQQELEQEGLFIETIDVEHVPKTTVTIFPDKEKKDIAKLDLVLPDISPGFSRSAKLDGLTLDAVRTLFNLVTCNRDLDVAMSQFLDRSPDVAAFCKNAGQQSLRVDYLSSNGQLAFYTPDFLVRLDSSHYVLLEIKGRVDKHVPLEARAAVAWCKAATNKLLKWDYLYVPQETFESFGDNRLDVLMRTCEPALQDLLDEAAEPQLTLAFGEAREDETEAFISKADFAALPPAHQKLVQQAIGLFQFLEKKAGQSFAPVFTPLLGPLDEASRAVRLKFLGADIPTEQQAQQKFFEPDVSQLPKKEAEMCQRRGKDLRRTLVDHNGMSPIGLLRWCLHFAKESGGPTVAVFGVVRQRFKNVPPEIYKLVCSINTFRNDYVAHQNKELTVSALARKALGEWVSGLRQIWKMHGWPIS